MAQNSVTGKQLTCKKRARVKQPLGIAASPITASGNETGGPGSLQSPTGPDQTTILKNKIKQQRARASMANISCRSSKPHTAPIIYSIAS